MSEKNKDHSVQDVFPKIATSQALTTTTKAGAPLSSTEKKTESLFSYLGLKRDDYSHLTFTEEEATNVRKYLTHLVTGSTAAVPLLCGGKNKCPFSFSCPFLKIDEERKAINPEAKQITPVGKQCLIELQLLEKWTFLYIEEYEINERSFTELQMVRELAEIELMLWRLNNNLAKPENAELVEEVNVGMDKQGNVLTRKEVNAFVSAKEALQNRKSKLVKLLVGDRQEKYKRESALRVRSTEDSSTTSAKLRSQMDKLVRQTKSLEMRLKETEGDIIDVSPNKSIIEEENNNEAPLTPEDLIDYIDE